MKALKIAGIVLGALVVILVVGLGVLKVVLDHNYFAGYSSTAPLDPAVTGTQQKNGYTRTELFFNGWRNGRVPTLLLKPDNMTKPMPCIVFLHGIGQDKSFVDDEFEGQTVAEPFLKAGFAFAIFDQYMRGERTLKVEGKKTVKDWLREANAFRLRPAYTINDARRLVDYLVTQPDIDPHRIYLVGASYGAITGSTAAAFDKRFAAVALSYGGGNVPTMFTARAIATAVRQAGVPLSLVQFLGWYLLSPCDPVKYIAQIAPRPLYMQNGTDDSLIASGAAKALQEAAPNPIIKIYEGDHFGADPSGHMDPKVVFRVLEDILAFLKDVDVKIAGQPVEAKPAA